MTQGTHPDNEYPSDNSLSDEDDHSDILKNYADKEVYHHPLGKECGDISTIGNNSSFFEKSSYFEFPGKSSYQVLGLVCALIFGISSGSQMIIEKIGHERSYLRVYQTVIP